MRKSSEWLESSMQNDLGMWFAILIAIRGFAFFKHCFQVKTRFLKRVSYLLNFLIRESEVFIFMIFVNHERHR